MAALDEKTDDAGPLRLPGGIEHVWRRGGLLHVRTAVSLVYDLPPGSLAQVGVDLERGLEWLEHAPETLFVEVPAFADFLLRRIVLRPKD